MGQEISCTPMGNTIIKILNISLMLILMEVNIICMDSRLINTLLIKLTLILSL
jgi:hypothetical protein